jgi:hypothetical protein
VPEAGQSEQTQRAEVGGLWDTQSIWTMSRGVDDKECPNQGRHGLHLPRRSPKVTTKSYVTCWESWFNYKKNEKICGDNNADTEMGAPV